MSMRSQVLAKGTTGEYLVFERASSERHEFLEGEIFAMGGASERHNLIVTNVVRELGQALKSRPCRVYANDLRVKVAASDLHTYPDVVVSCGESHFDDEQPSGIALDGDGRLAFASNFSGATVTVVDLDCTAAPRHHPRTFHHRQ
jgi:Uma2 family endonuclease